MYDTPRRASSAHDEHETPIIFDDPDRWPPEDHVIGVEVDPEEWPGWTDEIVFVLHGENGGAS